MNELVESIELEFSQQDQCIVQTWYMNELFGARGAILGVNVVVPCITCLGRRCGRL